MPCSLDRLPRLPPLPLQASRRLLRCLFAALPRAALRARGRRSTSQITGARSWHFLQGAQQSLASGRAGRARTTDCAHAAACFHLPQRHNSLLCTPPNRTIHHSKPACQVLGGARARKAPFTHAPAGPPLTSSKSSKVPWALVNPLRATTTRCREGREKERRRPQQEAAGLQRAATSGVAGSSLPPYR